MKTINYYKLGGFIILGLLVIALVGMLWLNSFKIFDDPQVIEAFSQCDRDNNFKFSAQLYTGNAVTNRSIHLKISECDGQARETEVFIADSPNPSLTEINTSWKGENELLVEYNDELRIFRKEEKIRISGKVLKISYEPFRVLSKSELRTHLMESNKSAGQELLSNFQNEKIKNKTEKLMAEGVDSLILFETWYPGSASINIDSCDVSELGEGKVFWFKDGIYSGITVDGLCVFYDNSNTAEMLFNYTKLNYEQIQAHPILPLVYEATQINGRIRYSSKVTSHEPKHSLFIILGDLKLNYDFNESDMTDSLNLFYKENMNSPVFKVFKMQREF